MNNQPVLREAYALIAELWCNPEEIAATGANIREEAAQVIAGLETVDEESAMLLDRFMRDNEVTEEDYIDLFELNPQCPLYLGSHSYEEPKTCAGAAVSDRNEYMIELAGIYRHFGKNPVRTEMPDYLPLMVDFLALTCDRREDPVRVKFLAEYFLPFLPPLRKRLEELGTSYRYLLDALSKVASLEATASTVA